MHQNSRTDTVNTVQPQAYTYIF